MRDSFNLALRWVLAHEGGYVNHPDDPGGETNRGVTRRVYDAFRARKGLALRSVREITDAEVTEIYRRQYWDAIQGDALPAGVDYAVFDFAVNSGPRRAAQFLQRAVGVAADGVIGEVTLNAVERADPQSLIPALCRDRMAWLRTLSRFGVFGVGWHRRVMGERPDWDDADTGVIDRAIVMAIALPGAAAHIPDPHVAAGRAEPEPERPTDGAAFRGSVAQVVTGAGAAVAGVGALDGTAQIFALAFAGAVVLLGLWIMRDRIKRLADGVQ